MYIRCFSMARSTYNSIIRIIHIIPGGTCWDSLKAVYVVGAGRRQNTKLLRSCCESGRWRLWPLAMAQAALFWPETPASLCTCHVAELSASQGGAGTRAVLSPISRSPDLRASGVPLAPAYQPSKVPGALCSRLLLPPEVQTEHLCGSVCV